MIGPDPSDRVWYVDGNNVVGSVPDGWWNDPGAAAGRLAQRVAEWCRTHDDRVVLVFDGRQRPEVAALAGGNLEIRFAPGGRNAADDAIVAAVSTAAEAADERQLVVTADRGLRRRLAAGVAVVGPRSFLDLLPPGRSGRSGR